MEVQYNRLVTNGSSLASNTFVGSRNNFTVELSDLQVQWGPLKDNIADTLDLLIRSVMCPRMCFYITDFG